MSTWSTQGRGWPLTTAIPDTFFIDPNGIVAAKITGESTYDILMSTIEGISQGNVPALP